jgi:hypothetical protein
MKIDRKEIISKRQNRNGTTSLNVRNDLLYFIRSTGKKNCLNRGEFILPGKKLRKRHKKNSKSPETFGII